MGRPVEKTCDVCCKTMRCDTLKRHMKQHVVKIRNDDEAALKNKIMHRVNEYRSKLEEKNLRKLELRSEIKQIPQELYSFRVVLGGGCFGTVYSAVRKSDGLSVAIKKVRKERDAVIDYDEPCEVALMHAVTDVDVLSNLLIIMNIMTVT